MLIFLDIDGVLRRTDSKPYQVDMDCLDAFEGAVRRAPGSEIVISSSWREVMSLDELRDLFSPDIAMRIVGVTPMSQDVEGHRRHQEILAYLEGKSVRPEEWVAIDDQAHHFPGSGCNVLIVDPSRGFDSEAGALLVEYHAAALTEMRA